MEHRPGIYLHYNVETVFNHLVKFRLELAAYSHEIYAIQTAQL